MSNLLSPDVVAEALITIGPGREARMELIALDLDRATYHTVAHAALRAVADFAVAHGVQLRAHVGGQVIMLHDLVRAA